ncbi:MAG: class I SAM-dependent methyltransferase [Oscillospiraceae bacterium]|nr:class I SAM-dependent methyltransferase [Oscillospiraceae bacterium]
MLFTTELQDVLFFREHEAYVRFKEELDAKYPGSYEVRAAAAQAYRLERIGSREGFIARMEDYAQNGGADVTEFVPLRREDVFEALRNGTAENGAARREMAEGIAGGWAMHLRDYGRAVNYADNLAILELGTGAGMGTWAVASQLRPGSVLVSTDFDPLCVKNADGIARHLGLQDRMTGLLANFRRLPFADASLDVACTHYALDEAREVPAILDEMTRVLRPGGRFILCARVNPWDRQKKFMEPFGIAPDECDALLKRARMHCGPEGLTEWAARAGLALLDRRDYTPEHSHARTVITLAK